MTAVEMFSYRCHRCLCKWTQSHSKNTCPYCGAEHCERIYPEGQANAA